MRAEIETLYFDKCCGVDVKTLGFKALDNLDFNAVNDEYVSAIDGVLNTPKYGNKNYELSTSLKRNVSTFTAFRNHYFNELLSENKPDVHEKIVAMHYRYLETEKALVSRTTRSAKQWVEYERTADIYPNLEYLSSRSADKRDTHKELYGTIRPINDPFWDTHLPPNGWGCKCRTRKTDATPTAGNTPSITLPKGIVGNAGKNGVIFGKDHSLINNVSDSEKKQIKKELEQQKQSIPYNKTPDYSNKNGSEVYVHLFSDDIDVKANFDAAKLVAKNVPGTLIKIRPHSENTITGIGKKGRSNPEYEINGKHADLKRVFKLDDLENTVTKTIKQGNETVIFNLLGDYSLDRFKSELNGQLNKNKHPFKEVFLLVENKVMRYK